MNNLTLEKFNGIDLYNYHFNSFIDLISYLNKTPDNSSVFSKLLSHSDDDLDWIGNESIEKAKNTVLNGSKINEINDIITINKSLEENLPFISKRRNIKASSYGFRPNISKFLNGNPNSMYKLIRNTKYNNIDIIFSISFNGEINQNQILNRGICTLNLIKLLSNFGYDVNFRFLGLLCDRTYDIYKFSALKEYIKFSIDINTFDLATLYYPLCDKSFYRRIIFSLIEKTPVKSGYWIDYGEPINDIDTLKNIDNIKDAAIITSPERLNIKGDNIIEDFISFYKRLNIEKYLDGNKLEYDDNIKKFILRK